jgi:hypothetical protein
MATPKNKALYSRIKAEAKEKFDKFPSAYSSMWIVREYKSRGGTYEESSKTSKGTTQWRRENWVNLTPFSEGKGGKNSYACGEKAKNQAGPSVCRPKAAAAKFTKTQIKKAVEIKKDGKRIDWSNL